MTTYETFEHGGDYTGQYLDFSASIAPLGVPASVKEALADLMAGDALAKYPDPFCTELREKIAEREGCSPENILCGNGSAELIFRLAHALMPKKAVIVEPAFSLYEKALEEAGCRSRHCIVWDTFSARDAIPKALRKDVDVVFLASPANPTGMVLNIDLMRQILDICQKKNILLVWDATFVELSDLAEEQLQFLRSAVCMQQNLLVLRSFTKYYAMPGIRLGYCMSANKPLLAQVARMGAPWSVSTMAQAAGLAALESPEYEAELIKVLNRERRQMYEFLWELTNSGAKDGWIELEGIGILKKRYVYPSCANYFLLRTELADLPERLLEKGIKVRSAANFYGLDEHWVRFCLRSRQDNRTLKHALKEVLDGG